MRVYNDLERRIKMNTSLIKIIVAVGFFAAISAAVAIRIVNLKRR